MIIEDQWVHFKSKELVDYSFKYSFNEKHLFFITDLKNIYSASVRKGNLASTCPGLEGTDECLLETIFDKVADQDARASFKSSSSGQYSLEITSQIKGSVEKTTFRLGQFNELGVEGVHFHLIAPLIHMQAEMAAREKQLLEIVSRKDVAIAEYKTSGATILASIDTSPFSEGQLESASASYSSLNEALEQSGLLYSKSVTRTKVKSESVAPGVAPKRTRTKYNEAAVQQQEQILSSVIEGTSKIVPKRKTKARI
ncbi:Hypothetical predicted protein [Cloeon dipterum]|uniref:XLF-like coiled-coil region domain-containing protein n=1 Tax=Cloeon dipterum TaxID=197152 RepID=A0A8S1CEY0_9INSE|nr:Hypothetical predicted protein [Cloeon dipterum]